VGREEGPDIRARWLGLTGGSPNIFEAIKPGEPRLSSN
jgi:hypothetical protein